MSEVEKLASLVHSLRGLAGAYPESVFPEVTDEEGEMLHRDFPGLQDRLAASMGRHLGQFFTQAANALEALSSQAVREQALEAVDLPVDAEVYWRDAIGGDRWTPLVWGKHRAAHPSTVKLALRIAGQRAPECADTIAALVWSLNVVQVRERCAWDEVRRLQDEIAAIRALKDPTR